MLKSQKPGTVANAKRTALALVFLCLAGIGAYGQEDHDEVLRINTSLVVVPIRVVDANSRFVPELRKENFRVFEDSVEQEIAYFEADNAPFTVALVMDVSDSASPKLKQIQEAAIAFVNQLRPDDRAIVFALDSNLVKVYDGKRRNLEEVKTSIRLTRTGSGTSLYDAVESVIDDLNKTNQRKKAIVLFTDGIDSTSRNTNYAKSLRVAQESNALIYSIQYNTATDVRQQMPNAPVGVNMVTPSGELWSVVYERGTRYLKSLTANSGGRFYLADSMDNLSKTFAQIAAELSQQYSLSYYPHETNADGKKRLIKIKSDVPGAKIVTRKNYTLRSSNNSRSLEAGCER